MFTSLKQEIFYYIYGNFKLSDVQEVIDEATESAWYSVTIETKTGAVQNSKWPLSEEPFSQLLREQDAVAVEKAAKAKAVLIVQGQVENPGDALSRYMEVSQVVDVLALMPQCVAVVDLKISVIYSATEWSKQRTLPLCNTGFDVELHIQQMAEPQDDGRYWLHTVGMIKFGKPELCMRGLSEEALKEAGRTLNALAQQIIVGDILPPHGQDVVLDDAVLDYKAFHGGGYEDDEFWGNVHIELGNDVPATR